MAEELAKRVLQKVQAFGANMLSHVCSAEGEFIKLNWLSASLSTAISGITFPLCLGAFQSAVFRPLRITSNLGIVSLFCGSISVAIAGGASSLVFLSSATLLRENEDSSRKNIADSLYCFTSEGHLDMTMIICPKDSMLYGFASLVVFKIFGGRFRMVLPSSLFHPGAFARAFIPAKGQNYASDTVKRTLTSLGKKYGCHSCGQWWRTSFVGDHMPPNKLVKKGNQKQKFYPQCTRCSNQQGAALSTMSRQLSVMSHGSSLRLYHLWLPLPIPLALLRNHIGMNSQTNHLAPGIQSQTSDNSLQGLVKDVLVLLRLKSKDKKDNDSDSTSSH